MRGTPFCTAISPMSTRGDRAVRGFASFTERRRGARAIPEGAQWEAACLVPLDEGPRSAHDEPLHAQSRRPLHLEPRRLHSLGADKLLVRIPDAEMIDGDRATHLVGTPAASGSLMRRSASPRPLSLAATGRKRFHAARSRSLSRRWS